MIGIIDYKSGGNIHAYKNIFRLLNVPYILADQPDLLEDCNKIILPGVGSFDSAVKSLKNSGFYDYIQGTLTSNLEKQLLGVCVGLQVLCNGSEEGRETGLGIFNTTIRKFDRSICKIIPHTGWNSITIKNDPVFRDVDLDYGFYFLHGYRMDAGFEDAIAHAEYNSTFACAARTANFLGLQFHPEKSHSNGMQIIKNFLEE